MRTAFADHPDGDGWERHDGSRKETGDLLFDVVYASGHEHFGVKVSSMHWENISDAPLEDLEWFRPHVHEHACKHCGVPE